MRNTDRQVLIVDDYNTMRRILRNLLGQIGFANVEEAEDGAGGLKKMRERNIGLVISDWNMAPMSGLEFLKEVRNDALLKETPFNVDTLKKKIEAVLCTLRAPYRWVRWPAGMRKHSAQEITARINTTI